MRTKPAPTLAENVKKCITCAHIFFLAQRYLFLWFGFRAKEFTCANLKIKGDQFRIRIFQGEVYVSSQRIRLFPRSLHALTSCRLRQQLAESRSASQRRFHQQRFDWHLRLFHERF